MISWGVEVNDYGNAILDEDGSFRKVSGKGMNESMWAEMVEYANSKGLKKGDYKKLNLPFENKLTGLPADVTVLNWNSQPINVEIPVKVTLTVTDAPPGIRGDSVSAGDKVVTMETGLQVTTPLFIKVGDKLIINTEKGTYVSRA